MKYVALILRIFLAAVFALAAISKLSDQNEFRLYLGAHNFIPPGLVPLLTVAIPALELSLAVSLIHTPKWNALRWILLGAMTVFAIYHIAYSVKGIEWGFPPDGTCKCMKLPQGTVLASLSPLLRSVVLLCVAGIYFRLSGRQMNLTAAEATPMA
jgi:hypothetical protein